MIGLPCICLFLPLLASLTALATWAYFGGRYTSAMRDIRAEKEGRTQ